MSLKHSDASLTAQSSGDDTSPITSNDHGDSTFNTPKKAVARFRRLFSPKSGKLVEEFLDKPGRPCPPKNENGVVVDMDIADVEKRMNQLWIVANLLTEDQYGKLCFIIGKGLDKAIVQAKGKLEGRNTLYEIITKSENSKAQRFDTI